MQFKLIVLSFFALLNCPIHGQDTAIITTGVQVGLHSSGNSTIGIVSSINFGDGIFTDNNDGDGVESWNNLNHGFFARENGGDGFRSEACYQHGGYFVNRSTSNFPSVFIAHGDDNKLDLMLGGNGRISSDEHIYLDVDGDSSSTVGKVFIRGSDGTQLAAFSESGNSDINTSLDVLGGDLIVPNGNVCANNIVCPSDIRFKTNIQPISDALETIRKMHGVTYQWNFEKWPDRFDQKKEYGLIAQELEKIVPELVFNDESGYKSVDYLKITAILIEAVKELEKENDALKSRIDKIEQLDARLSQLEKE